MRLENLVDRLLKNYSTGQSDWRGDRRAVIEDIVRDGGYRMTPEWGKGPGGKDVIRVTVETNRGQSQAYASLRGRRIEEAQTVALVQALRYLGYGIAGAKSDENIAANNVGKGEFSS